MATPAATATTVTSIPWWKEPTRDQWYAFVAAWAGWTLDAFDFTAFLLIIAPIAKEFNVPVRSGGGVDDHAVDAASRRHSQRVAGRSNRPQDAADDFDCLVFGLQLPGRPGAEFPSTVPVPGAARHWHRRGRGMASRRGPRDGDLAGAIARLHGRRAARLVG